VRPMRLDESFLNRELPGAELLVNATSLGWHPGETPIPLPRLELLPAGAVVADLTYRDTDLLLEAQARGLETVDGLPMLVHQGARAFELWTGFAAPVETMLAAARAARAAART
jgi:shikimate dehydrogenase